MQEVIYWALVILFQSVIATKIAGYALTSSAKHQSIVTTLIDLGGYVYYENRKYPFTFQFLMCLFYVLNIIIIWYALSFNGLVLDILTTIFALTLLIETVCMVIGLRKIKLVYDWRSIE
jgi:hypothetical protein